MTIPVIITIIAVSLYIAGRKEEALEVKAAYPARGNIDKTVPASGKIRPVTEIKISPDVSGEIVELHFKEGDPVRKGDLVIKIRQDLYLSMKERAVASLNSVKAQYLQQEARLAKAELNFRRNKELFEKKAISESEYEEAYTTYQVSQSQLKAAGYNIESAAASVREAEENLAKTLIYAPMDGVVSRLMVEKGERVVGTTQMAGTEMLRIADLDKMEVLLDVNENDIAGIHCGDTAFIDVDACPGHVFKGTVTHVAHSAKNVGMGGDRVTVFEVKVLILPETSPGKGPDTGLLFKPGMSASVQIRTSRRTDVLTVPVQAVSSRTGTADQNGSVVRQYVFVIDTSSRRVESREIRTGIQDIYRIEVTDGLSAEDLIVISPYSAIDRTLRSGDIVEYEQNPTKP